MSWSPRVTVAAVVERHGRFLMIEETSGGKLVINQPAGHLEDNESLADAMVRETLEESAWHVQPVGVVGIYLWRHPVKKVTVLRVAFAAKALRHDPDRILDTGIERALWLSPEEIRGLQPRLRSPLVLTTLETYLQGERHPLSVIADKELDALISTAQSV